MVMVQEKIERFKGLADLFIKENSKAFIKELNNDIHFCDILINGEDTILIKNFAPKKREGIKERLYWLNIIEFDKLKNKND
jgi:hypothetical protein